YSLQTLDQLSSVPRQWEYGNSFSTAYQKMLFLLQSDQMYQSYFHLLSQESQSNCTYIAVEGLPGVQVFWNASNHLHQETQSNHQEQVLSLGSWMLMAPNFFRFLKHAVEDCRLSCTSLTSL